MPNLQTEGTETNEIYQPKTYEIYERKQYVNIWFQIQVDQYVRGTLHAQRRPLRCICFRTLISVHSLLSADPGAQFSSKLVFVF